MLIRPFSDIHVEFWKPNKIERFIGKFVPPLPTDDETVVVIAGDLGLAHKQETWLRVLNSLSKRFQAVVYVEGNHFFYKNDFFSRIHELKGMVTLPGNVYFLENESVEINGVVFIGATLWTDFMGRDFFKMQYARKGMNDFELIKKVDGLRVRPEDTVDQFDVSKKYIFETIKNTGGKKTVVVTHHGISPQSIHERFKGDSLNCAFMTDLTSEVTEHGPDIWVHGHTHDSFDYMLGRTRVIVNPFGYKDVEENRQYDKELVVEL